jgi:hypothetical protein
LEFSSAFLNPFSTLFPAFVETQKTALSSSFNQHVWLRDEFPAILDPGTRYLYAVEDFFDVGRVILRGN